tara:strand:- start:850 stop:1323 length:474 start_codon:yes stop_codon:yes gene_type:complete
MENIIPFILSVLFWGTIIYVIYRLFKSKKAAEVLSGMQKDLKGTVEFVTHTRAWTYLKDFNPDLEQAHSNDSFSSEEKNSVAYVKWIIANAGAKFMTATIWSSIGLVISLLCTLISVTSKDLDTIQGVSLFSGIAILIFATAFFINFWNASKLMRNI